MDVRRNVGDPERDESEIKRLGRLALGRRSKIVRTLGPRMRMEEGGRVWAVWLWKEENGQDHGRGMMGKEQVTTMSG